MPTELGDAAGRPLLVEALRRRGLDDAVVGKICHGNWRRVLTETWKGEGASVSR